MDLRDQLNQMSNKVLYLNLLLTQFILAVIGTALYFFFLRDEVSVEAIFNLKNLLDYILLGAAFALLIVVIDILLIHLLAKEYFDDGGINERLFRDVNVLHIALIALLVSVVEEWVFRGVLQNIVGLFWASLIFAAIHIRYFKKKLYALLIITVSFGFGLLYHWTESIWSVIVAHFLIDFSLGIIIRYGFFGLNSENNG